MNKSYFSICFVLNFFYQSLVVCNSKNFTSLVRFISEYFIVFDAIVAEILSFFFRHSIDSWIYCYIYIHVFFYMMILYPETLLKFLTSSSSVLWSLWDFLYVRSYNLQKKSNFIFSSFPVWKSFISFSFPISLAKISSTLLNRSVRVGILVLFLILDKYSTFYHWV